MVIALQSKRESLQKGKLRRKASPLNLSGNDFSERSPGLIVVHDLDGKILYANPAAAQSLGYSVEDLIGRSMIDLITPSVNAMFVPTMEQVRLHGSAEGITPMRTKQGEDRKWWVRQVLWKAPGRAPLVLGDSVDITSLRLADDALHESEQRFRYLADHIHQVFWIRDPHTNQVSYVSPAFESVWGRPRADILDNPPLFFESVHPDDRTLVLHTFGRLLRGEATEMEYRILRPDGGQRWIWSHSFPTLDEQGKVERIIAITEDISDRKQHEEDLRRAKEEAEAQMHAKSELLAHVSHEIRTPLQIVMGMAEIMRGTALDAEQSELLERIEFASENLHTLANDLLNFSKAGAGRVELREQPLDPRDVLRSATEPLAANAAKKGISLRCNASESVPTSVIGDPDRLRQVLANLIGNALKFTERGEVVVQVELADHDMESMDRTSDKSANEVTLRFSVRDTGPGIAPDDLARIFEPFSQAHTTTKQSFGGVGLGLAICRQFVQLFGGRIWVVGEVGLGSTFYFTARFGLPS
ncbi:MAG: PAS domain S-box protein [Deltaproteobacteria bacterium]|nr:PAS domain S-box protein [Deltaproteobacteria bacterium]